MSAQFPHHQADDEAFRGDQLHASEGPEVLVRLQLSDEERLVLREGLSEWGGSARCTEELANAMGFRGQQHLLEHSRRIREDIGAQTPLSRVDWTRALLATEIAFASDIFGSGVDWSVTTGLNDAETLEILRSLQRKLPVHGVVGVAFGTRPPSGR